MTLRGVLAALFLLAPACAAAADASAGQAVFEDRCSLCHQLDSPGQGPMLKGVVGRKAAALPDFAYSDALKKSGLTWTPATLDAFLAGPSALVPGTAMVMTVPDPVQRADVVAFLSQQK